MRYLLDANIFIQGKNRHYGFDFCPAFWLWLETQNAVGKVASIEKVGDELQGHEDDLATWAEGRGPSFFLPPDEQVLPALATVATWSNGHGFDAAAISTFLQGADYWLVAHALAHGFTVVTHEMPANSAKKIKIPNVCVALKVPCVSPYEMLRRERARFVLGPSLGTS
jgi:hypothetical protein